MVKYKHNQPHYELQLGEIDEGVLRVLSFEGEEAISRPFEYRIGLLSDDAEVDPDKILNKAATFVVNRGDGDPVKIHGIISEFEQRGKTSRYVSYDAVLVPRLWRLGLTYRSEIYQGMTVQKLVIQVLQDSGFSGDDYRFDLKESYPGREYLAQYRETNLNFINRRLEHYGIFYFFEHGGDKDVVVFADHNGAVAKIASDEEIPYNPNRDPLSQRETISDLSFQSRVVTGQVRLKDYNYRTPARDLTVESQIDANAPGLYYEYGDHYKDTKEGDLLARVRNEELLSRSKIYSGSSDCRLFLAGVKFTLDGHYRSDWNGREYLLTRVSARGTQRGLFATLPDTRTVEPTYENSFEAVPINVKFRPQRMTPVPRLFGIMNAVTEAAQGEQYADIDDQGCYRLKMPFDLSAAAGDEASAPVRLASPHAGPGYGLHLPQHAGVEIVWGCIDGNVDRPIGLGAVPNPSQASPVTSGNKNQNIIRTASGNEIVLDDKINESQVLITTGNANQILLDDKNAKIDLLTTNKHKATLDDANKNITVQTKDGHLLIMDDDNTKITVQSKNGHRICIDDGRGGESITLADQANANIFIIDITNNKLVIKTKDGSIDMHAPNGTIDIKATTLNIETSADTSLKAMNILLDAQSRYELKSNSIKERCVKYDLKADLEISAKSNMDLKLKGTNVEVKADMNAKINGGMNLEATAGMQAKLEGMMTDVSGSAMTKIKGGIVMIN